MLVAKTITYSHGLQCTFERLVSVSVSNLQSGNMVHKNKFDLKIRSYPFAYLTISDTCDILIYRVCLLLSSLWLPVPQNNKCMYVHCKFE